MLAIYMQRWTNPRDQRHATLERMVDELDYGELDPLQPAPVVTLGSLTSRLENCDIKPAVSRYVPQLPPSLARFSHLVRHVCIAISSSVAAATGSPIPCPKSCDVKPAVPTRYATQSTYKNNERDFTANMPAYRPPNHEIVIEGKATSTASGLVL